MDEESEPVEITAQDKKSPWLVAGTFFLALGSIGPANAYLFITDPAYTNRFHGWRILVLPIGGWMLTGFFMSGLTVLWVGGVKRSPDWSKRADQAWASWCKLGLWLVGIGIAVVIAVSAFVGLTKYLSGFDRGTLLITGVLVLILLALLRIGDQIRRR